MYTNETILTPLLRYVFGCIERDESEDFSQACAEIRVLCTDQEDGDLADILRQTVGAAEEQSFLKQIIGLLEMKSSGTVLMRTLWEKEYEAIENEPCGRCIHCKRCRSYFWQELRELLFQEANELKQAGVYLPVRRIPEPIRKNLLPSKRAAELYYYNNCRKRSGIKDGCIILKGMSSSTPSLMNSIYDTNQYSGGGFYLRHNGVGVAIDPGYHFLDNLHHYGLSVLDINVVVVTHEHIDHNNDIRLLDDLHHAVYKYEENKNRRQIRWYLDEVTYKVALLYQENGTGFAKEANVLYCVSPETGKALGETECIEDIVIDEQSRFRLKCFITRHIENKKEKSGFRKHTFGCQFKFGEGEQSRSLMYTSDTRYFDGLIDFIDMPDIVIANISGVYEDDFMLVKAKERHLGYYGCYHLLQDIWKSFGKLPALVMLSEFWNGENDIRYDVAASLERQIRQVCSDDSVRVIPAEVGMTFQIMDGAVRCSQCGRFTKHFFVRRPSSYQEKIRVLCESCVY